jgi:hypothetical protein
MKTFSTSIAILFTLCAPALADSVPPAAAEHAEALKVRFAQHDTTTTRTFDVLVGAGGPCATASEKLPDHEIELQACVSRGSQLDIVWSTRSSWGEYRSTSSLPFVRGATAELGTAKGPRLGVVVQ